MCSLPVLWARAWLWSPLTASSTHPSMAPSAPEPGGHAVCLVSDGGVELLIHIGIDTVNLKGKHFAIKVKEGDKVKAGDLLAEVDVAAVRAEGYKTTTPIIVTNSDDYLDVFAAAESGSIRHGDKLLTVIKKG